MTDFTFKHETADGGRTNIWACIGPEFAMHIHITDRGAEDQFSRYYGGLEFHYRTAPDYLSDKAPSHTDCWLLKAPCWHDGTSVYASEVIIPFWEMDPTNNERMFDFLKREYQRRTAAND